MEAKIIKNYLRDVIEWETKKAIVDKISEGLIIEEKYWRKKMEVVPIKRKITIKFTDMIFSCIKIFGISFLIWTGILFITEGKFQGLFVNLLMSLSMIITLFVFPIALPIYFKIKEYKNNKLDFENQNEKVKNIKVCSKKSIFIIKANQQKLHKTKKYIEEVLEKLYNANIIYRKYCNLEACSAILEYLESGRCYELEGPHGAYNKFDNEASFGKVATNLEKISSQMDIVIANQKELTIILDNIKKNVNEMKENIKTICATTQNIDKNISEIANLTKISAWSSTVLATQVPNWNSEAISRMHDITL